ncbi:MAG: tetratricopeptide repeat protein [Candidatus Eremiobacteraeota bacterium]|nr:tetratricopeptide repeat protein [Candidatus Eremiobacteraeota bacterium]
MKHKKAVKYFLVVLLIVILIFSVIYLFPSFLQIPDSEAQKNIADINREIVLADFDSAIKKIDRLLKYRLNDVSRARLLIMKASALFGQAKFDNEKPGWRHELLVLKPGIKEILKARDIVGKIPPGEERDKLAILLSDAYLERGMFQENKNFISEYDCSGPLYRLILVANLCVSLGAKGKNQQLNKTADYIRQLEEKMQAKGNPIPPGAQRLILKKLADSYRFSHQWEKAEKYYNELIEHFPKSITSVEARIALAIMYVEQSDIKRGLIQLSSSIEPLEKYIEEVDGGTDGIMMLFGMVLSLLDNEMENDILFGDISGYRKTVRNAQDAVRKKDFEKAIKLLEKLLDDPGLRYK